MADSTVTEKKTGAAGRIGERLVALGVISKDQLNVAIREKQKSGKMLGETLVALGFINENALTTFLSESTGLQQFDPRKAMIDPEALALVSKKDAQKYQILPIAFTQERAALLIAMADPHDVVALDRLKQILPRGVDVVPQVCSVAVISDAIHRAYGATNSIDVILKELGGDQASAKTSLDSLSEDEAYSHPLVRLVNAMILDAVKMGASDLHFEPEENFVRIRYRIDGDLATVHTFHRELWNGLCQRVKILAELNIADKLSPQDGRFSMNVGGRDIDFRVSTLPTVDGENIVIRVLDKNVGVTSLDRLGFSEDNMRLIQKCLARPEGMIIVTGPTGSGKTTTLYAMLGAVNTVDVNIMTLEDPVEYSLGMVRQSNIRENVGLTFGEGLKAILRQDPDIIFVGEIRDDATAEQALKAAMTGHQVFTTLHTNDSFGALPRLMDLGLQAEMISGAVIACFAQRLVRKICPQCRISYVASSEECRLLAADPAHPPTIHKGEGCKECSGSGTKGRLAVHEILYIDEEIDTLISSNAPKHQIRSAAIKNGFKSMRDDGIAKVYAGLISIDALTKAINFSDRM